MSRATSPAFAVGGICQCGACSQTIIHKSDCAVHRMPASPNGPCDCGAETKPIHHAPTDYVDVVCDGFPNPDGPRFIELENESGHSINYGEWIKRNDGHCVLRIPLIKKD